MKQNDSQAPGLEFRVLKEKGDALLREHLLGEMKKIYEVRRADLELALAAPEALRSRQKRLRERYARLIGPLPERTALNARVAGVIEGEGYRIEKVVYESEPNRRVTANLYLPAAGKGPFPGVLTACGHEPAGKATPDYARFCMMLARRGTVALCVDPIGQGERFQLLDAQGAPATRGGTLEHTLVNVGGMLVGYGTVQQMLWDNMRGIDYLVSRAEVDPERIGCAGSSGGGTQATFLMAFDERVKAAAICCYLMRMEDKLSDRPADGCQHLAGEGAEGLEIADYLEMAAPKPVIVLAAKRDIFDIESTRALYREAKRVYERLGAGERLDMFEWDDGHGFSLPRREAGVQWLRRRLADDASPVSEDPDLPVYSAETLRATETGQVLVERRGASATDLSLARARAMAPRREAFWRDNPMAACLARVRELVGARVSAPAPTVERAGEIERAECRIEKIVIRREGEPPIPAFFCIPKTGVSREQSREAAALPSVLYVDGRGKEAEAGPEGEVARLVRAGRIVLSIDARGCGETADDPKDPDARKFRNAEYRNAVLSFHIGRSLIGQRVEDIEAALESLLRRADVDPKRVDLIGIGAAGPAALHAAALDARFAGLTLRGSIQSWIDDVIAKPLAPDLMAYAAPNALEFYDLPDLVKALAPRRVEIVDPFRPPQGL